MVGLARELRPATVGFGGVGVYDARCVSGFHCRAGSEPKLQLVDCVDDVIGRGDGAVRRIGFGNGDAGHVGAVDDVHGMAADLSEEVLVICVLIGLRIE